VFLNDAASGATLDYYGTLLGICNQQLRSCWVHVPALGRVIEVLDTDLLVCGDGELHLPTEEFELSFAELQAAQAHWLWRAAERKLTVELEPPLQEKNDEVRGKYRLGSHEKGRFVFSKRAQPRATYHFSMSAAGNNGMGKLEYFVPADCVLNREFVMLALSEILNVAQPRTQGEEQ